MELFIAERSAHEVVVVKPAGMATQLSSDPRRVSLLSKIEDAFPNAQPRLPHRLDRVARGLVLVALTPQAASFHGHAFQEGRVIKHYLARVRASRDLEMQSVLGPHKAFLKKRGGRSEIVRAGGKPSFLDIVAIARAPHREGEHHLLVRLQTGRHHQIRVMLAGLGIPLVGDLLYGEPSASAKAESEAFRDFYLEHAVFSYTACGAAAPHVVHVAQDPQREPLSEAMREALKETIAAMQKV